MTDVNCDLSLVSTTCGVKAFFLFPIIYLGFPYGHNLRPSFWSSMVEEGYKVSLICKKHASIAVSWLFKWLLGFNIEEGLLMGGRKGGGGSHL